MEERLRVSTGALLAIHHRVLKVRQMNKDYVWGGEWVGEQTSSFLSQEHNQHNDDEL